MTKVAVTAAAGVLMAGLTVAPAVAATAPAPNSPSVQSTTAPEATTGSANADVTVRGGTSGVGGGIWTYGVDNSEVYSVFKNDRYKHSSTACAINNQCVKVTKNKGTISDAHRKKSVTGNTSFWNIY